MPSTLTSTAPRTGQSTDPARARGLRRTRVRSPCPPVELVAIPRKPSAAEVLVLVSRARQARIDAGVMSQSRLFDLRAYKSVLAELSYYRRLAYAGAPSAHVATSMPQLIKGLSGLHPSWKMTGDPLEDRDRHHSAVRRRLRAMVEAELIVWTRGVNLDGEEARTELLLLEPPQATPRELAAARAQLAKWRCTHGARLNTGSSTGIRDITKAAAPPSPAERRTRARNRVQQLHAARIRGASSPTKTAPPFGASLAYSQQKNNGRDVGSADAHAHPAISSPGSQISVSCSLKTGARAGVREIPSTPQGAVEGNGNCLTEEEVDRPGGALGHATGDLEPAGVRSGAELSEEIQRRVTALEADPVAMERLAAEQTSVDELHAAIGRHATNRARELASSPADRAWPPIRVREAWALARYGPDQIGPGSATAIRLSHARHAQLLRAVKRYDRYIKDAAQAAHEGAVVSARLGHQLAELPRAPWAAFLHLAASAAHQHPAGTIQALDIISRQLRALATATDPQRREGMKARAHARHAPPKPHQFHRLAGREWPQWLRLGQDGQPLLIESDGEPPRLDINHNHPHLTMLSAAHRRLIERDAWLVLGHWPPAQLDGRQLRHDRATGTTPPAARREPLTPELAEQLELARLEPGLTLQQARRLSPDLRTDMLHHARTRARHEHQADHETFQQQLAEPSTQPSTEISPVWRQGAK